MKEKVKLSNFQLTLPREGAEGAQWGLRSPHIQQGVPVAGGVRGLEGAVLQTLTLSGTGSLLECELFVIAPVSVQLII